MSCRRRLYVKASVRWAPGKRLTGNQTKRLATYQYQVHNILQSIHYTWYIKYTYIYSGVYRNLDNALLKSLISTLSPPKVRARKRESARKKRLKDRRAVGMNAKWIEPTGGGRNKAPPVTTACPEDHWGNEAFHELNWNVQVTTIKTKGEEWKVKNPTQAERLYASCLVVYMPGMPGSNRRVVRKCHGCLVIRRKPKRSQSGHRGVYLLRFRTVRMW